tara:strand:- start:300 stop:560 length:261 start_codon:yes stop_codon:yes gene_type:complete
MGKLIRSDHRLIEEILKKSGKGGVHHDVKVYNKIGASFEKLGGKWEAVVRGCPTNTKLLKLVIKFATKKWFKTPNFPTRNKKVKDE